MNASAYHLHVVSTTLDRSELALLDGLRRLGVRISLTIEPDSPRRAAICAAFPETVWLPVRHRLDLGAAARLRKRLSADPPDILHAPMNRGLAVALQATRGMPIHVTGYRGTLGHLNRWDPAAWLTYLHPRLSRIVCVSKAVEAYLRERIRIAPAKLTHIYKGHDPTWYDGPPAEPLSRATLGLPPAARVVGFVGQMRPVKGVAVLIRALDWLPEEVHLLLAGTVTDPELRKQARQTPARRRRTHFIGHTDNVLGVLDCCDLFAMPSLAREGLPRAAIEAMCRRLPIVASRVGGLPELVEHGVSGWVIPPGDAAALADAIARLSADPALRRRMGEAARHRIETTFHIQETLNRTLALHRELLRR